LIMTAEAVVTVRLVRSFEHRNFKPVVFHGVRLEQTVQDFMQLVKDGESRAVLHFKLAIFICFFCFQTNELVMSLDDDETLILQEGQTLRAAGVGKIFISLYIFSRMFVYCIYKDPISFHNSGC
uniref:Rad60/SUMO-like domain-containing protein n=1 Tax=Oreochromis aureus TaxID=47969 RepID=A0AAZ1Y0Z5_OREAU